MTTDMNIEYQQVKFGQIAKHISKRVEPSETELDIYVGLEHIDPDSLKITRHGIPSDVAGQKLLVKKGQIIFGKRRAYQRKVAVADWDCICSAHAMVLEAIPGKVLPEFLPFFMQSNQFMDRAVDISEGSLSPTIKWKVLEQQIFKIPKIEYQLVLLDLLQKVDENINNTLVILEKIEIIKEIYLIDTFLKSNKLRPTQSIKELCVEKTTRIEKANFDSELPYIGFEHITSGNIHLTAYGGLDDVRSQKLSFNVGDLLYGKIRPYLCKCALATFNGLCSSDLIVLKPSEGYGVCLASIFTTKYFSDIAMNTVKGTKMPRADWKVLKNLKINSYSESEIVKISNNLENMISLQNRLIEKNQNLKYIKENLL